MLARPRRAHPDAGWVRADARALPVAAAFDLAVSFGALGHFLPADRPPLFAGVHRALRPGGVFAFPAAAPPPATSGRYWALLGFDLAIRVRNALWRPPVRHVLPDLPAARGPQRPDSSRVHRHDRPLDGSRPGQGREPAVPACPRAQSQHILTAAYADVREPEVASITKGNFRHSGQVAVSPNRGGLTVASAERLVTRRSASSELGNGVVATSGLVAYQSSRTPWHGAVRR
jgi:SAM-dependent methyltransferase